MVYTANTPNAGDKISVTQPLILANFQDLDTYTQVDHIALNEINAGKHHQSTYPSRTPSPVLGSGEGAVYTIDSATIPGRTDLYYKYQTSVAPDTMSGLEFPLTAVKAFGRANTTAGAGAAGISGTLFNATVTFAGSTWTIALANAAHTDITKIMVFAQGLSGTSTLEVNVASTTSITVTRASGSSSSICFWVVAI